MHLMLRLRVQADELEHGYRGWTGMMVHSLYGIDYLHHIQILLFMLPTKERVLIVHHTDYTVSVQKDLFLLSLSVSWFTGLSWLSCFIQVLLIWDD